MKFRFRKIIRSGYGAAVAGFILILAAGLIHPLMADDKTYSSLKMFTDVLEELEKNYVDDVNSEELIHNAIKGMVGNLDPHSSFMPPEAFEDLQDDTKGEFSGIGIVITMKDGILTVVSPIEGTPAYKAGIQAGDMILRIDEKSTKDMELWEAVNMMRGPRNKPVHITVIREGEPESLDFSINRDLIPMESVRSATLKPGFGYLRITNFRMNTMICNTEINKKIIHILNKKVFIFYLFPNTPDFLLIFSPPFLNIASHFLISRLFYFF